MYSPGKEDRESLDYLNDILESIADIRHFTRDKTQKGLAKDKKTLYAVIRCFEILGEAVKKVPKDIKKKYPQVPWEEIAGMRDKLIHEYFGVDTEIVWKVASEELVPLKPLFEKLLE